MIAKAIGLATFLVTSLKKIFFWVVNGLLGLVGKIQRMDSSKDKRQRRIERKGFRPWRAGCIAAVQLAVIPFLVAFLVTAYTVVAGATPNGVPLEQIVRGRVTWIGRLLSRVSLIDPEQVAYGALPSVRQSRTDKEVLQASALPTFQIRYWNGSMVTFQVPVEVWEAVKKAAEKHGCDPLLVVAVAHSESPVYDNVSISSAGCQGVWQFYPATWERYRPWPGARRADIPAAADGSCRMISDLGLALESNEFSFARNFNGADGSACWNCGDTDGGPTDPAVKQAKYVWRLWKRLQAEVE
jgi:hypothetical protein